MKILSAALQKKLSALWAMISQPKKSRPKKIAQEIAQLDIYYKKFRVVQVCSRRITGFPTVRLFCVLDAWIHFSFRFLRSRAAVQIQPLSSYEQTQSSVNTWMYQLSGAACCTRKKGAAAARKRQDAAALIRIAHLQPIASARRSFGKGWFEERAPYGPLSYSSS